MTAAADPNLSAAAKRPRSVMARLAHNRLAQIAVPVLFLLFAFSFLSEFVIDIDPRSQDIFRNDAPPSPDHWLGTDELGRDILSRAVVGGQVSLLLGLTAPLISAFVGTFIGMLSAYFGGRIDAMISRFVDFTMSFDALLLGVLIAAAMGPSATTVVVAISVALLPHFVRMARATTFSVRNEPYVEAAIAAGRGHISLLIVHILPNIIGPLVVMSTLWAATAIRLEATLSFIGLGAQPPTPSWGNMVRDGMTNVFGSAMPAIVAGTLITLAVLAFNMLGDALRDALDPGLDD